MTKKEKTANLLEGLDGEFLDMDQIGEATIYRDYEKVEGIPTGSLMVDYAFTRGRGVPRRAITQLVGESNSGKTTVAMMTGISAIAQGLKVAVNSAEGRWPQEYMYDSGGGKPGKDYLLFMTQYMESTLNSMVYCAEHGYDLYILDSATALGVKDEVESDVGEVSYAKQAKAWSEFFRMRWYRIVNSRMALIVTNQIRMKIGVMYGSPKGRPGGEALKFYSSIIADFKDGAYDYKDEKDAKEKINPYGMTIKADVWKNSVAPPRRPILLPIRFAGGLAIDSAEELCYYGSEFGVFTGKSGGEISGGSHWYYKGKLLGETRQKAKSVLNEDPDMMVEVTREIRSQMGG